MPAVFYVFCVTCMDAGELWGRFCVFVLVSAVMVVTLNVCAKYCFSGQGCGESVDGLLYRTRAVPMRALRLRSRFSHNLGG